MKRKLTKSVLVAALALTTMGTLNSCKDHDEDLYAEMKADQATLQEGLQAKLDTLNKQLGTLKEAQETCCKNSVKKDDLDNLLKEWMDAQFGGSSETTVKDAVMDAVNDYLASDAVIEGGLTNAITDLQNRIGIVERALEGKADAEELAELITKVDDYIIANNAAVEAAKNAADLAKGAAEAAKDRADEAYLLAEGNTAAANAAKNMADLALKLAQADSVRIDALDMASNNMSKEMLVMKGNIYTADSMAHVAYKLAQNDSVWISEFEKTYSKDLTYLKDSIDQVAALARQNLIAANSYTDDAIGLAKTALTTTMDTKIGELAKAYKEADKALEDKLTKLINDSLVVVNGKINANAELINKMTGRLDALQDALSKLVTGVIVQGTENPVFGSISLPLDVRSNILMSYYGKSIVDTRLFPSSTSSFEAGYTAGKGFSDEDLKLLGNTGTTISNGAVLLDDAEGNAGTIYMTVNPNTVDFNNLTVSLVNSQDKESGIKLGKLAKSDHVLSFGYTRAADNGFYEAPATLAPEYINSTKLTIDSELKSEMSNLLQSFKDKKKEFSITNMVSALYNQFNGILDANAIKVSWKDKLGEDGAEAEHAVYSQYNVAAASLKPLSFKFLEDTKLPNLPTINPLSDIDIDLGDLDFDFKYDGDFKIDIEGVDFNVKLDSVNFTFDFKDLDLSNIDSKINIKDTIVIKIPDMDNATFENGELVKPVPEKNETIYIDTNVTLDEFVNNLSETLSSQIGEQMNKQINEMLNGQINQWNETINKQLKENMDKVMKDITEKLQGQVDNMLNDMLADINTQLNDKIGDLMDKINGSLRDNVSGYIGKLNNYINRINSFTKRINSYINNANHYLQVTMLYEGADGAYHQLSNTKALPSVFKLGTGNATTLLPTTYTAEIAAPAYKKFVAVTNIYGAGGKNAHNDATLKAALEKANSVDYLNEVIPGKRLAVPFQIDESLAGCTYEITYSALDYSGYSSTNKFYVKISK